MPVKLFQAILTVCILLGSTSTWSSPNPTPPFSAEEAEKEKLRWNNIYKLQFTPLQIEILSYCSLTHPHRKKIVDVASQTLQHNYDRPQIIYYLERHSYDLHDQIVNEIITTFDSQDKDKIKSFITYMELGEANQFFDEMSLKLTPKGLEMFDPQSNLFSPEGRERRAYAKMQQEEYMRRHESLLITKESELRTIAERLEEEKMHLQNFMAKVIAKKEKLRQAKAKNAAKIEAAKKYESELQAQAREIQKAHERRLEKEEELLKQREKILEEGSVIQKIQADLMRKEHDLEIKEKAINLASLKLVEKINSQKATAERDLVNDFLIVGDYYGSGENALPTRNTHKGEKSNSKRFRPSIAQSLDQLEADAKLLGSMCRTQSRDFDFPEDSEERFIE